MRCVGWHGRLGKDPWWFLALTRPRTCQWVVGKIESWTSSLGVSSWCLTRHPHGVRHMHNDVEGSPTAFWRKQLVSKWVFRVYMIVLVAAVINHSKLSRMKNTHWGASLVVQWLRIHLPMQGTQVRALVQEDPTCREATKAVRHNYWACALEPASHNYWARVPQLLKPAHLEPMLCNKRSHRNEKPAHRN